MIRNKKLLLYLCALSLLMASVLLTFASVQTSRAARARASVTDYTVPGGGDPWGTAFDSAGNVWVAVPGCDPNPDCGSSTPPGKIEEFNPSSSQWITYQLPSGYGQALFLAFDLMGNLWFPMFHTNTLGEMLASDHSFHQWSMGTPASGPWDLVCDHNGKLWITEHYVNKVAEFDPTTDTLVQELTTQSSASNPYGITVDASNNIWFTENNSADTYIDEYTNGGVLQRYMIGNGSVSNLTPHLITVDPNGNIWWSEGWVGKIGELNIAQAHSGTNAGVYEYQYPRICKGCSTHTSGISVDSNGLVWFDDSLQSSFGSFNPGRGSFKMYNTPTPSSHPHDGLNVDGLNRVWFDEEFAGKLAVAVQA